MSTSRSKGDSIATGQEQTPFHASGMLVLLLDLVLMVGAAILFVASIITLDRYGTSAGPLAVVIASLVYLSILGPILLGGLKVVKPNEALVFTLFGSYHGVLRTPGFYFVNPFVSAVNPVAARSAATATAAALEKAAAGAKPSTGNLGTVGGGKAISLKAMTLSNDKQKVNDALGNPIIIGVVVIWKVVNPTKAVFNVDNYPEFLSIQCDSALRNIVRLYPYDSTDEEGETSLRGSSQEVAQRLKEEIQSKTEVAGIEILEARITHLSYAPEIAAAMLQRQQASAIIAARQMIVEGAVGMVEMALEKLNARHIVDLDEERKAAMVSNLLVVLCSNKDTQPVVNSGSIY